MESTIRVYKLNKPIIRYGKDNQKVVLTDETNSVIQNGSVQHKLRLSGHTVLEGDRVVPTRQNGAEIIPEGKIVVIEPVGTGETIWSATIDDPVVTAYTEITPAQYAAFKKDADSKAPAFQGKKDAILKKYDGPASDIEMQKEAIEKQKAELDLQNKALDRQKSNLFEKCQAEIDKLDNPTLENTIAAELF